LLPRCAKIRQINGEFGHATLNRAGHKNPQNSAVQHHVDGIHIHQSGTNTVREALEMQKLPIGLQCKQA